MSITELIEGLEGLMHLTPATEQEIAVAERTLNIRLADEYKEYVRNFGAISASGMELTGVTAFPRLSVVEVTKREKENNDLFPFDMYVVEDLGIEGLLILQNSDGEIFEFDSNGKLKKLCDSLFDYISGANKE